ncbi:hypothetical protein C8J56DRAFT_252740 [Mycena floridula]|nr:hypothetical protein C8J56DRAFT_252740 [Mycena floridula]
MFLFPTLVFSLLGFTFATFTETTAVDPFFGGLLGYVQKNSKSTFCYFPGVPGTALSCNADANANTKGAQFSGVMAAHLAQGKSIAYYGPDAVFLGDVSFPYPSNAGFTYVCVSGTFNSSFQTLCAIPGGDNLVIPVNSNNPPYCMVGSSMTHVDDGCYVPEGGSASGTDHKSAASSTEPIRKRLELHDIFWITITLIASSQML